MKFSPYASSFWMKVLHSAMIAAADFGITVYLLSETDRKFSYSEVTSERSSILIVEGVDPDRLKTSDMRRILRLIDYCDITPCRRLPSYYKKVVATIGTDACDVLVIHARDEIAEKWKNKIRSDAPHAQLFPWRRTAVPF